jgi:hypothetical protein
MKELRDGLRGFLQRRIDRRRRNLRGDLREFRDIDSVALSQHHGAKDGVLELADVPRPVEGAEQT